VTSTPFPLIVMARLVRATHNPLTVWMARIKRAMTN
jgi:hypothetical protein